MGHYLHTPNHENPCMPSAIYRAHSSDTLQNEEEGVRAHQGPVLWTQDHSPSAMYATARKEGLFEQKPRPLVFWGQDGLLDFELPYSHGPKDHVNISILHCGSKARDRGDCRNNGCRNSGRYIKGPLRFRDSHLLQGWTSMCQVFQPAE